jgi:hypothetical protein
MGSISFTPATDRLGHTARLDHAARFPLLGLPLDIRSNSRSVIDAAERSFGRWRALAPELVEPAAPLIVDLIVHVDAGDGQPASGAGHNTQFIQRVHVDTFLAAGGANVLTAQMNLGRALAFVTPELVADDLHFRYNVLECLALLLASWRDRTPVHAGAIVREGRAALLVGPSTAGKSTLCYACARAGLTLLAEDVVYVGLRDGVRLWGSPWRIHLLPDAPRLFPELCGVEPAIQANGKRKLAVDVVALGAGRAQCHAERAVVCLVERGGDTTSALTPIEPGIAVAALSQDLEAGFDLHTRARAVAEALAAGGAYRLTVGTELAGAVAMLDRLLGD